MPAFGTTAFSQSHGLAPRLGAGMPGPGGAAGVNDPDPSRADRQLCHLGKGRLVLASPELPGHESHVTR